MTDCPDVVIDEPNGDEIERVTDLWVRLASEQREHDSAIRSEQNRSPLREILSAHQVRGGLLVARNETSILGFVSFTVDRGMLATTRRRGTVSNLYVEPSHRGRDIGSRLLSAAERRLADRGVDEVTLEAMAENERARRFYGRAGYEPSRVTLTRSLSQIPSSPTESDPGENDTHSKDR